MQDVEWVQHNDNKSNKSYMWLLLRLPLLLLPLLLLPLLLLPLLLLPLLLFFFWVREPRGL